MLELQHVIFA